MLKCSVGIVAMAICASPAAAQAPAMPPAHNATKPTHYVRLADQPGEPDVLNANLAALASRVRQAVADKKLTGRALNQDQGVLHSIRLETTRMTASGHRMSKQEQRVLQGRIDALNHRLDQDTTRTH